MVSSKLLEVTDFTPNEKAAKKGATTGPPKNVAKIIAALSKKDASDYKTWVAMGHACKHESDDLYAVWAAWSMTAHNCDPRELQCKWDSFDPRGDITIGSVLYEPKPNLFLERGFDVVDLLAADLRTEWVVEGILAKDSPLLVAGMEKTLKTTLVVYLLVCLATGKPFLGTPVKKMKVAIFSGESGNKNIRCMIDRMSKELGVEIERGWLFYTPMLPRFDQSLDLFQETLRAIDAELVVVDPVYQCMNGEQAGNLFEMGQQLKTFSDAALQLGVTPVLLHHLKKDAWKKGRINLGDITWAGFREWASQWWGIRRTEDYQDGRHNLVLDVGGRDGQDWQRRLIINEGNAQKRIWTIEHEPVLSASEATYLRIVEQLPKVFGEHSRKDRTIAPSAIYKALDGVGRDGWTTKYETRLIEDGVLEQAGNRLKLKEYNK